MDYKERWDVIEQLGRGGQGKVYRVLDKQRFDLDGEISPGVRDLIQALAGGLEPNGPRKHFEQFRKAVVKILQIENPENSGALKVLHQPEDARDFERAKDRIRKEIEAMSKFSHDGLLKILDYDPEAEWFVSEFFPKGSLARSIDRFTGDFPAAVRAVRPLVEAVAELHKNGLVHRDITPKNVFVAADDRLVLGDFGLVYFEDQEHTRISGTWDNVGSRDWMPAWAMGRKIDEVSPAFDVFSLGKLLWAMVSEKSVLPLWYFAQPEFNLESMFPDSTPIKLANPLFEKCIVQHRKDCLGNAQALLEEIDSTITILDRGGGLITDKVSRPCKVCGVGYYEKALEGAHGEKVLTPSPAGHVNRQFKTFICPYCGHVQFFALEAGQSPPPAWSD